MLIISTIKVSKVARRLQRIYKTMLRLCLELPQQIACGRGPWGDNQISQGDETITTHMGGATRHIFGTKEVLKDHINLKAYCEGTILMGATHCLPRDDNIILIFHH